ncbi:FAD-binding and (Fe-S)-binding domain-containing protein [Enhydrobacter sp.]|jgi:FAD/FMN-containing dehydrogenase/Fe-S oxidoreductase|uniref:FAD-binding and (Fe-S)-binding domain-containing protein n=1 Tax=Enhydrobacter sp. TaxID=1894999 RepID=UPI002639443F|nr:FAD-binding and (Fe-S)-binding domain-containing protein [Enhydrobacter sp.]WIM13385.1 MAG: FAD-binding protein [Enhydrobacter sp.]
MTSLEQALRRTVKGDVLFDRASRGRYSTDASIYQIEPIGIIVPHDETDLALALDVARDAKAAILPRGAGTSQCGQTVGEALVVDFSKYMRNVVGFDKERAEVVVQPGVVLDQLNAWLRPHGLWYPVDVSTAAQCTLGGMAGNNSCGSRSIRYGNMVHNVAAIDAILADGTRARFDSRRPEDMHPTVRAIADKVAALAFAEQDEIARQYPKVLRRVGGYNLDIFFPQSERPYTTDNSVNLAHLLVGSEGTLAVTERLTLRLSPLPKHKTLGVVNFPSFYKAMESAQHIVTLKPTAVELVDRTMIELARANPAFRPVIEAALIGQPEAILLVEFAGEEREAQLRDLGRLVELMADLGLPGSVIEMPEPGPQSALWEVRKAGLNIMMSMKGDGKPVSFIEDCAVPLEHLADYTQRLTEVFEKHGTRGTWYAHASVGTLHVRPILDMRRDGAEKMRAIAEEASALVREYKGAYSGEHGDGLVRSEWVAWQFGPRLTKAFESIKALFDPENRLNPGKIVRPPRMDDRALFRFKPDYRNIDYRPALDWSAWNVQNDPRTEALTNPGSGGDASGGFAKAVEMCNNNGHCRKFDAGTMCPSFRVTRDEIHLTRGRANTLRLALSGQLGPDALTSDAVAAALDLCVSCKGCKRDCPTGVDMARMKIEVKSARRASKGLSLRDKLIGDLPAMAPWARRLPALFNLAAIAGPWLGFARQRSLPRWRRDTFLATTDVDAVDATVVIFADTFSNYFEPAILHAARRVLEAAGHRVAVAWPELGSRALCCGRTYLATGQVDRARDEARRLLEALSPFVARGVPVVGLEPSCLFTMRDEFLGLGLGDQANATATNAFLFEEFLAHEKTAGRLSLALKALPEKTALLHGHCHQKAFGAMSAVQEVLALIPELAVKPIESSCCGMAGSFGYEAEHYDTSIAMAELSLLPAVRAAAADTLIVADGTSCRHQIADGTRRHALHVAEVLERALAP